MSDDIHPSEYYDIVGQDVRTEIEKLERLDIQIDDPKKGISIGIG